VNATLGPEDGPPVLRFERRLAHPVEKVWKAITDAAELTHWFPQDLDGSFTPGAKLRFVFRGEPPVLEGKVIEDFTGEVLELDPPRVLAYTWGGDILRWTLTPDGEGCLLVFTDTLDDRGKAARDGAGWHVCLDALEARLAGSAPPPGDRWKELYERYTQSFGPEAATASLPG
jgi:uncharacterized protein YndB with AHSA1/START domain